MSLYQIGIDLGTTNCSLAYVEIGKGEIHQFLIPQEISRKTFDDLELLPSCCYLDDEEDIVGYFAKEMGSKVPTRLIYSSKSWLCNGAAKRREKILPLNAFDISRRKSPLEVAALLLKHLGHAWNKKIAKKDPQKLFENQDIIITLPASFDQVARLLTLESAKLAGISNVTFLEEPQAAFYSWLYYHEKKHLKYFSGGESILVVDMGGGTLDFSLIEVTDSLQFERQKVGRHLLLGGDNMDEALAHLISSKLSGFNEGLWQQLVLKVKEAKEELLSGRDRASILLGSKGASVVKGAISLQITKDEVEEFLLNGFFKYTSFDEAQMVKANLGLLEGGLAYEKESSILKHLARFLTKDSKKPSHILFNGGALKPHIFREAIKQAIANWYDGNCPIELESKCLSLAVSKGAAYFGMVQKGFGVKVKSSLPCTYFLEVQEEGRKKAIALIPRGEDFGYSFEMDRKFFITPNTPVEFNILYSNTFLGAKPGHIYPIDFEEMACLPPLKTVFKMGKGTSKAEGRLSVFLTHLGSLELKISLKETFHQYLLEFALNPSDVILNEVNIALSDSERKELKTTFRKMLYNDPKNLLPSLENILQQPKNNWPASLLRVFFDELMEDKIYAYKDPVRFWNLAGFLLRPGIGFALDDWRIKELWKVILNGFKDKLSPEIMTQKWICFRRIALGLSKGSQIQIASTILAEVYKVLEDKEILKSRQDDYLFTEKLRLLASLELLEVSHKQKLSLLIAKKIGKKIYKEVYFFALSRLLARSLLSQSITHVVPPEFLKDIFELLDDVFKSNQEYSLPLLKSIARKTPLKHLNLDETLLNKALSYHPNDEAFKSILTSESHLDLFKEEKLLADTLPNGLVIESLE
jgi:hypothetical protein